MASTHLPTPPGNVFVGNSTEAAARGLRQLAVAEDLALDRRFERVPGPPPHIRPQSALPAAPR